MVFLYAISTNLADIDFSVQVFKFCRFLIQNLERSHSTTEFIHGFVFFNSMAIFNVIWVTNYINITQNAANSRFEFSPLICNGIQTTSKHLLLIYCSCLWRFLSREVTRFSNSLLTVLVTTTDDSTWPRCSQDY